jgi:hypothetical protein
MGTEERSAIFAIKPSKGIYESTPELRAKYTATKKQHKASEVKRQDPDDTGLLNLRTAQIHIKQLLGL